MRAVPTAICVLALTVACDRSSLRYADLQTATPVGPGGHELVLDGMHGACDDVLRPDVVETQTDVRVRVPLQVHRGDCRDIGLLLRSTVTLQQPLGERTVIDAETNRQLPAGPG